MDSQQPLWGQSPHPVVSSSATAVRASSPSAKTSVPNGNLAFMTSLSPSASRTTAISSPMSSPSAAAFNTTTTSSSLYHSPSPSQSATQSISYLHPLQKQHRVTETRKALIDSHELTGRKLINQYEVIEEIGRGMHGKVKLARNTATGENVAIKIVPRFSKKRRLGRVTALSHEDKTRREIAILKKIRHDNVVALFEVIDDPELKKIYMVLEHVELGEIVWRKKGLPHVCLHERRRVEREARYGPLSSEEERQSIIWEHRAALREMHHAKIRSLHINTHPGDPWSLEHGPATDDSNPVSTTQSKMPSRDEILLLDMSEDIPSSVNSSVQASRCTSNGPSNAPSNAPSRTQSLNSIRHASIMVPETGPTTIRAHDQPTSFTSSSLPLGRNESALGGHILPSLFTAAAPTASSTVISSSPLSSSAFDCDLALASAPIPAIPSASVATVLSPGALESSLHGRSSSMADSFVSHMSSVDFNPTCNDPFADDYSYVPCFTFDQARNVFRDTVLGLEYLHYQGVVHRDIKPANLLCTRDYRIKIADFGVSYFGRPIRDGDFEDTVSEAEARDFVDDDIELARTVGTPAFFAPELCHTDIGKTHRPGRVSEQIDVWSLGVTLYCLIFARIPFLAEDEFHMFMKIAKEDINIPRRRLVPVSPVTVPNSMSLYQKTSPAPYRDDNELLYEDLDPDLHDLLQQMLIKNPEKRIKLRDIKRHPWVLRGILNPVGWLDDTDPARPSKGRKIQVDEREMSHAVIPLRLLEFAKSVMKKTVSKLKSPLGGGGGGWGATGPAVGKDRSGYQASSSVASSVADSVASISLPVSPPTEHRTDLDRSRRRSLRGDDDKLPALRSPTDNHHHHRHHHHHHLLAVEHQLTSTPFLPTVASPTLIETISNILETRYHPIAAVLALPPLTLTLPTMVQERTKSPQYRRSLPHREPFPLRRHHRHINSEADLRPRYSGPGVEYWADGSDDHLSASTPAFAPRSPAHNVPSFSALRPPNPPCRASSCFASVTCQSPFTRPSLTPSIGRPQSASPASGKLSSTSAATGVSHSSVSLLTEMASRQKRLEAEHNKSKELELQEEADEEEEEALLTLTRTSRRDSYCRIEKDVDSTKNNDGGQESDRVKDTSQQRQSSSLLLSIDRASCPGIGQASLRSQPVVGLSMAVAPGSFQKPRLLDPLPGIPAADKGGCSNPAQSPSPTVSTDHSPSSPRPVTPPWPFSPVVGRNRHWSGFEARSKFFQRDPVVGAALLDMPPCLPIRYPSAHGSLLQQSRNLPSTHSVAISASDFPGQPFTSVATGRREKEEVEPSVKSCGAVLGDSFGGDAASNYQEELSAGQMINVQSNPSLPALVSGASSVVSTDLESEILGRPDVLGVSTVVPPLLDFDSEAGKAASTIVPDGVFSFSLHDDNCADRADSDSDEGLLMIKKIKKSLGDPIISPNLAVDNLRGPFQLRRRDTNISTTSTETAKGVPFRTTDDPTLTP